MILAIGSSRVRTQVVTKPPSTATICPVIQFFSGSEKINDPSRYIVRVAAAAERDHLTLLLLDRLDLLFGKSPSNRVVPGMSSKETLSHALTSDIEALRPAFMRTPGQAASALRLPQRSSTSRSDFALEQHGVN